jgi:hypothetical protein
LTFLFDENISQLIVDALEALGKPVVYLTDILPSPHYSWFLELG